ncbi:hypothetical protein [Cereibacter azotoformans]|uniref:Uncharacterized protein n=1 Tax=Cereibacter azotoformans TaxID=43057 RepID=A0A2T5K0N6_9RHOB|nr:hypothetical protein [Cereibacter azotoformans]MBO4169133.1 hypothetical protein [Cereibacter azotoformans]PTR15974.1 hypothetical protein C8J28_113122 [Cereibacter azotoformans]
MSLIDDLKKQIAAAEARIREIQHGRPHPEVAVIVRGIGYQGEPGKEFRHCTCGLCEAQFTRGMVDKARPSRPRPTDE